MKDEKYYRNFEKLPLVVLIELACDVGLPNLSDGRWADNGSSIILELVASDYTPGLVAENLVAIAEFFGTSTSEVYVSWGYKKDVMVVEILDQSRYGVSALKVEEESEELLVDDEDEGPVRPIGDDDDDDDDVWPDKFVEDAGRSGYGGYSKSKKVV
jgi:hypothetical protein